jgi:hypothetical protein
MVKKAEGAISAAIRGDGRWSRERAAAWARERPLLCTEFMARTSGSTFQTHLPVFRRECIGCFCWGLVSGRTQTAWSWKDRPGSARPPVWFHDVLRPDGTAFDEAEVAAIRRETAAARSARS